ncbi:roadblock/LC7 domain-containing protein [Nocardioides insulae]|uniref:roadblock/LC7 domain-containing protein n=1 Tax=Nocardioides insulae TaxID=394734 RepID=UPI00040E4804|nr:roadblock/LC7 domain-containing protein [Nocardioides insulae]
MTTAPAGLDWLVEGLTQRTPDIAHAILVSAEGLPMASSSGFPSDRADQLSAITSGLTSLTQGAARCFSAGAVQQMVIEMDGGYLVVMQVGEGSSLAALASPECDLGQVGYQMQLLIAQVATALTPATRGPGQ